MSERRNDDARGRLRRRAEQTLPGRPAACFLEDEMVAGLGGAAIVCAVRRANEASLPGFTLVADRPHRQHVPLHRVLSAWHPLLGRPFEPGRIFHHVGERTCERPAPGLREECWVKDGPDLGSVRETQASPVALAWITAGGLGFLPVVGATMASVAMAGVALGMGAGFAWDTVRGILAVVLLAVTIASVLVERAAARHFLTDDPREFVLDEVAGMALALLLVPSAGWPWGVGVALLAFRFFDVLKPGIAWVERTGWRGTIVWDDLLAGVYAGLCTLVIMEGAARLGLVVFA